jgi:hypothetical protein
MFPLRKLAAFALRQVLDAPADAVIETVERYIIDHGQTLPRALSRADNRAWQALGLVLAGDGLLDRVKGCFASGDDKGVREQVQAFLRTNAASLDHTPDTFRQACLHDLKRLRKSGVLSTEGFNAAEVAHDAAGLTRATDTGGLIEDAQTAVSHVADVLAPDYPNLATLLRTPTPSGPPLLAAAFAFFFRREVEEDDGLAHGLFFDGLRHLSAAQAKIDDTTAATHRAVLDMQERLQRLRQEMAQLAGRSRETPPQARNPEEERRVVKALLARFFELVTIRLAPGVEMTFSRISPGTFLRGSPERERGRKPGCAPREAGGGVRPGRPG